MSPRGIPKALMSGRVYGECLRPCSLDGVPMIRPVLLILAWVQLLMVAVTVAMGGVVVIVGCRERGRGKTDDSESFAEVRRFLSCEQFELMQWRASCLHGHDVLLFVGGRRLCDKLNQCDNQESIKSSDNDKLDREL